MKIRGRRYIAPVILNLGTSWRRVVNFTSQPSELWERVSVPIDRSLGGLDILEKGQRDTFEFWSQLLRFPTNRPSRRRFTVGFLNCCRQFLT